MPTCPRSSPLFDPPLRWRPRRRSRKSPNKPSLLREVQQAAGRSPKLRLNMLFAGSTEGAHRACVLLGIIATCRALGVPIQAYLAWAFDRLGTHRDVFGLSLEDMTPAAFKKTLG